ncbi:ankyrin repeat-containing domain protein [Irpex lacteus]|nr:ankyrin repeat-containing domain protein [Irpex lacteus]
MFRSIFNIDAMDALEDALSRQYGYSDDYTARLLTSLDTTEYSMARSSVFNAIGYTPLEYAVRFSPSNMESLLAEGFDASAEPTLAYAACAGRIGLFELLIDKGADVNMKDARGRTALHWACYQCYYNTFFELVRCAEDDIDWNSRTPEGQNALDLFETGMSEGWASGLTFTHVDEFRSAIISHMDCSQLQVVEDAPLVIPGAFPPEIEPSD